jgi:hypothetical protein
MRILAAAFVSLSLIAGLASVAAAPAAAAENGYATKKKKKYARYRAYRAYDGEYYYYQRWADRLPYGTTSWWHQMDREQRGGRR